MARLGVTGSRRIACYHVPILIERAVLEAMIVVHLDAKANITGPMELLQVESHNAVLEDD